MALELIGTFQMQHPGSLYVVDASDELFRESAVCAVGREKPLRALGAQTLGGTDPIDVSARERDTYTGYNALHNKALESRRRPRSSGGLAALGSQLKVKPDHSHMMRGSPGL